jgi:hypothetical protein
MAKFCLSTKMSPGEYKSLTLTEYRAFVTAWNEMNEVAG